MGSHYNNNKTRPVACSFLTQAAHSIHYGISSARATGFSSNPIDCKFTTLVHAMEVRHMADVDISGVSIVLEGGVTGITETPIPIENSDISFEGITTTAENNTSLSTSSTIREYFARFGDSLNASVDDGLSLVRSIIESATKSAGDTYHQAFSALNLTEEISSTSFSNGFKKVAIEANSALIDGLRKTITAGENCFTAGASFAVYSYGSVKEMLPTEIKHTVDMFEQKTITLLRPVSTASQQVYSAIEGFEKSLGLDPNDPLVPFFVLLGSSSALWVIYWVWIYGGYSGDLSPKSSLELLRGNRNAVLIDVRSEALRERDGIPDIRRAARFRCANVTPPEVLGPMRKLLKGGIDLDNFLTAVVIRNLKIVQDSSMVIIMDAEGANSKGIARSLRKLGVKKPYLVQGGFQSWVKQGLRIKELKPETTLTILNEEAEAILEDINPSPVQLLSYGVVLLVALYALVEWETTLQWIGVFGLIQTLYRRAASYESAADLMRDITLLLAPMRLGTQALIWATGKLETNGMRLPTSPSSSDVRNRVLQAAAKHEAQPSDTTTNPDPFPEPRVPVNENVDLSEA